MLFSWLYNTITTVAVGISFFYFGVFPLDGLDWVGLGLGCSGFGVFLFCFFALFFFCLFIFLVRFGLARFGWEGVERACPESFV